MKLRIAAALLCAAVLAVTAEGVQLMRGDVVTGRGPNSAILCPTPPSVSIYSPELATKLQMYTGNVVALDANGNLYALANAYTTPPTSTLEVFDATQRKIRTTTIPEPASSMAVDATGVAYVLAESGVVRVFAPSGALTRTFVLPSAGAPAPLISIDIAPDRCTLVYAGAGGVADRYDACSDRALPGVVAEHPFEAVRAMDDGGFAGAVAGRIRFYDRDGRLLQDLPAPRTGTVSGMAFDATGEALWVGYNFSLYRIQLRDHSIVRQGQALDPRWIAVFGETRPAPASVAPPAGRRRVARP